MATTRFLRRSQGPSAKGQRCAIALCRGPRPAAHLNIAQVEQQGTALSLV